MNMSRLDRTKHHEILRTSFFTVWGVKLLYTVSNAIGSQLLPTFRLIC
jgi:hypothetical protein